jgi:predicted lipid-binding transport protein (Tim44 family)
MKKLSILMLVFCLFALTACETELNEPATGALLGGGAGAGLGAIIGHQSGHTGAGTAIGAGAGALLGALVGEANRRNREKTKEEIREELRQQGYAPQPQAAQQSAGGYYQPAPAPVSQPQVQEVHTKYNPKTGETFPERYKYDPATGDELQYIR